MLHIKTKILLLIGILFSLNPSMAVNATALYDVDVLVKDESAGARQKAFKQGLSEVFVRISGDRAVIDKLKQPAATSYVKSYSYQPVKAEEAAASTKKKAALKLRMKVQYNGSKMEKYLLENGFPVWSQHRPEVALWVAVMDGKNEYVLKGSHRSRLKAATNDALIRRGIPMHWPKYDAKDRKILSVSDIKGGFHGPVTEASSRYTRGPALTGSIQWNGRHWQGSWNLLMKSGNHHWRFEDADYNKMINKAIDRAADAMGAVFAIHHQANKQLVTVMLDIGAVDSIANYRYIENYLSNLSAVDKVIPQKVDGKNAVFEVTLRSNETDFLNLINNDAALIKVAKPIQRPVQRPVQRQVQPQTQRQRQVPPQPRTPLLDLQDKKTETPNTAVSVAPMAAPIAEPEPLVIQQYQAPVHYYRLGKK